MLHATLIISALAFFIHTDDVPRFEAQVIDDNVSIGYGVAIGDVDGDRKPDILLADKKQFVWYRNGDWKRFVMVDNLTESDNVCIAARDIDGDGRVEVAVGGQWNPSETSDTVKSGSVHYLICPADPTQRWKAVKLHHEPVIHRMRWVKVSANKYQLVVLPLHGRGNRGGEGSGVKIFGYEMPEDPEKPWKLALLDASMHMTHNLDVVTDGDRELVYVAGREGVKVFTFSVDAWTSPASGPWMIRDHGFGEVRAAQRNFIAGIEPMHGNELTVYTPPEGDAITFRKPVKWHRTVLADDLKQGHGLAVADFTGAGKQAVVVGWREANAAGKVGVKIFIPQGESGLRWQDFWVDEDGMACEDLKVADLNGDGKPEIIAAGRASHNLKIYWNAN